MLQSGTTIDYKLSVTVNCYINIVCLLCMCIVNIVTMVTVPTIFTYLTVTI